PGVVFLALASSVPPIVIVLPATMTSGREPLTLTVLLTVKLLTASTATSSVPPSRYVVKTQPIGAPAPSICNGVDVLIDDATVNSQVPSRRRGRGTCESYKPRHMPEPGMRISTT